MSHLDLARSVRYDRLDAEVRMRRGRAERLRNVSSLMPAPAAMAMLRRASELDLSSVVLEQKGWTPYVDAVEERS